MRKPPRFAVALLERFVPAPAREEIVGDLLEEYRSRIRSRAWFWSQAVSISWSYSRAKPRRAASAKRDWGLGADLRTSLRSLGRRPGFSGAVLALLALAVAANSAMFFWIDGIWNRPLPYAEPERLVKLFHARQGTRESLAPPNYFDLVERQQSFESILAYWTPRLTLTGEGEPETLSAAAVSHTLFDVLGVAPALGRAFTAEDDRPGAAPVIVLAHGLFRRRFGSDPRIIAGA